MYFYLNLDCFHRNTEGCLSIILLYKMCMLKYYIYFFVFSDRDKRGKYLYLSFLGRKNCHLELDV